MLRPLTLAGALGLGLAGSACSIEQGCLGGDDGRCLPSSACQAVAYACEDDAVDVAWVGRGTPPIAGPKAALAAGDLVLSSSLVRAVFDAIDAPHALAPSGGTLLDLVPADGTADGLNNVFQAVGILPDDSVRYLRVDVLDERPASVSLVYRGRLDLRPEFDVVTRYELRRCEPGLRVRTEIHHGGRDPLAVFPADAFFWGQRGLLPFTPGPGLGFRHPAVELEELGEAFVATPYMTAAAPGTDVAAYAVVSCDRYQGSGFHSSTLSAVGAPRTILMPGDGIAFERFIGVAHGPGHGEAIELATDIRAAAFGDRYTTLEGRLSDELGNPIGGHEERVAVLAIDTDPARGPSAEAAPGLDGHFRLRVPSNFSYRVQVSVLGRALEQEVGLSATGDSVWLGELVVPRQARLEVSVRDADGAALDAELVVVPADPEAAKLYAGSLFGADASDDCSPWLGPPHGHSPACNRVLVRAGTRPSFAIAPGEYDVLATHGPFWSLDRRRVTLAPGSSETLEFELEPYPLLPEGALSADLHVHGAASYDSSLPDEDRALSFVASDVNVIVATDHDVVSDYAAAVDALGIGDRVRVLPGVETTGEILFYRPPGSEVPGVVGHFNFWPLTLDPLAPRHGAPDDERLEPATLFDRMRARYDGTGVAQLNHPFYPTDLGRDQGYLSAVGYDPRRRVPAAPDGTPEGELARRTRAGTSNLDFDVQEVMNGASVERFLGYRAAWFSFLNQGILRAATANSDSHTLAAELLGYARTVVLGQGSLAEFDPERFNDAVRSGRSFGTNGPVLRVCVRSAAARDADCVEPSLTSFVPSEDAELHVEVWAAPWIPVEEVRFYVNGGLAETRALPVRSPSPAESAGWVRTVIDTPLSGMLAEAGAEGDAWLVIETGMALPLYADLDDDGLADTTDNNGDGHVDERDGAGTFREPGRVASSDPRYFVQSIAPGVLPLAISNPLVVDVAGDGWTAPGLRGEKR
jgi:hypothetical protein